MEDDVDILHFEIELVVGISLYGLAEDDGVRRNQESK